MKGNTRRTRMPYGLAASAGHRGRARRAARRFAVPWAVACLVAATAGVAAGQQIEPSPRVELRGRGDADNDAFIRRTLRDPRLIVIARDTVVGHADTIPGTVLVVGATMRVDGVVAGDLVAVDANVFLRPTAHVHGSVRNIAGGFYPSDLATIDGTTTSDPTAAYFVRPRDDGLLIIQGITRQRMVVFSGFYGLQAPVYDRVDGVTLTVGAGLLLPRIERVEPMLRGHLDYRSQRGVITGGGELALPRGRTELAVGAERTTLTNERWISGDLTNSVSYFFTATDYRDYYEADRAYASLRRTIEVGPRSTSLFLGAQIEDARALAAGRPWTVLGTPREDNMPVDEGRITSVVAGGTMEWTQPAHVVGLHGAVEVAGRTLDGEHAFARYVADTDWAMAAFRDHTLRVQLHAQGPLPGTDSLPLQRWSFVGGEGTLHTFDMAGFRGDRVVFVETTYAVPVRRMRVRFLGVPDVELLHQAGMGWTSGERRDLEQNVGIRVRFSLINLRLVMDPTRSVDKARFVVGFNTPRRSYPWEPAR
ncbi:MAG TPA: hypothetical protein VK936_09730 [Longimicrobiales bacterium]|nr:hypothetical protein [Longimicrobiales bacterium]